MMTKHSAKVGVFRAENAATCNTIIQGYQVRTTPLMAAAAAARNCFAPEKLRARFPKSAARLGTAAAAARRAAGAAQWAPRQIGEGRKVILFTALSLPPSLTVVLRKEGE